MTAHPHTDPSAGRKTGDGVVLEVDRTREFRKANRRTKMVRTLRIACPVMAAALLGAYVLMIARTAGLVSPETLPEFAVRKIMPEDLSMKNPRYEGFNKDGGRYVFTAKTAQQNLTTPNVIKLNGIVGEIYQADKTRTDVTAVRGVFNNEKNLLDLYEEINVDSQSGLKARLTQATIQTKEDLLTSTEPVIVEFPNGSVRSNKMTLRQKAREATFTEEVVVQLTPPPDDKPKEPAAEEAAQKSAGSALFTPSNGPINIDSSRLDLNDGSKTALFTGSVRARQGDQHLTTPELEVFYEGEGMMGGSGGAAEKTADSGAAASSPSGKVRRIVAKKPVVMKRDNGDVVTSDTADFDAQAQTGVLLGEVIMTSGTDRRAASQRVDIDEANGTIVLAGDVVVTQGENELRGGRLAIDRDRGTAQLTSPPHAGGGPGRINARLTRGADAKTPGAKENKPNAPQQEGLGGLASFKTNPKAPVDVTSDSLDVDDKRKVAVFRGDVEAQQDTFKIRCAELSAFYKGEAGLADAANLSAAPKTGEKKTTELTRIEARKDVYVTSKDGQTATGDWADFDAKTNKVTMGGNVVLAKNKNMVRGTRLLIDLTTGESKIDTAPQNTASNPSGGGWVTKTPAEPAPESKGRASAVFFPQDMKQDGETGAPQDKNKPSKPANESVDGWSATSSPDGASSPAN
ncbi:LPS export ABC transporter periplasmic protein LptC [Hyphomicrobium sp.]|uniref:LPS export ABC transporter periplasmic protein LptC n=1 Tax=Hyphomicrobium sp. TaxID=82 RepID=UPI002E2EAE8E|nr:LPS export ABC transporter periplasmic protein LptC [Hyphomicrobium sp.]HEX2841497.1 LPS export ABC transporter periplasmic protein LptC [Hyphomicrobium sp.]